MGRLLKGLAIAAGAGLGVCVGAMVFSRQAPRRPVQRHLPLPAPSEAAQAQGRCLQTGEELVLLCPPEGVRSAANSSDGLPDANTSRLSDDELLRLEPVLDRLERIEAFVDAAESLRFAPEETLSPELASRLQEQDLKLQSLHSSVTEVEARAGAALDLVRSSVGELRSEMPSLVESSVAARVAELETRLRTDAREQWNQTLETFENTLEQKISDRIGAIEKALQSQSASINILRSRSEASDENLQRLIVSIERLCQVIPSPLPAVPPQPQLVPRAVREPEPRTPRIPMARIFGAALAFGLSRFFH